MLDDVKVGSHVVFSYHGGSNCGGDRFVKFCEEDSEFIKGVDITENKFKQYRRDKISDFVVFAKPHEEIYPLAGVHPQWRTMSPNQVVSIFKIIHPDKKNVRFTDDAPYMICDGPAHKVEWNVSERKIYFKMNNLEECTIPMGDISNEDVFKLAKFLERYT